MEHLRRLKGANVLPFPIHRVQAIDLKAAIAARAAGDQGRYVSIPYFLANSLRSFEPAPNSRLRSKP